MSGHTIKWTHHHDLIRATFTCLEPEDGWCRIHCNCDDLATECDTTDDECAEDGHDLTGPHCINCGTCFVSGPCAPVEWMEAEYTFDGGGAYGGPTDVPVHDGAVTFNWNEYYYTWSYA